MKAIILVDSFAKQLESVNGGIPQSMTPIADQPFLAYLMMHLKKQGIDHVVLSVHALRDQVKSYFGFEFDGMQVDYVVEDKALGTGGAMARALATLNGDQSVFVLSGDTFAKLDYRGMFAQHKAQNARLTIALRQVQDCSRYGKVTIDDEHVTAFNKSAESGRGFINSGVYLMNTELLQAFPLPENFSFEKDFLTPYVSSLRPRFYLAKDYFIDIGVPEDYARAQRDLPMMTRY